MMLINNNDSSYREYDPKTGKLKASTCTRCKAVIPTSDNYCRFCGAANLSGELAGKVDAAVKETTRRLRLEEVTSDE